MKKRVGLLIWLALAAWAPGAHAYSISLQEVTGGDASGRIEVQGDGTRQVTFTVTLGSGTLADIRGVFFQFDSPPPDLAVSGGDVTRWLWRENQVSGLGGGVNMNGAGPPFDFGVEIGTPGIGKDDIGSTTFTLSSNDVIDLDQRFGLRLTSVGENRSGSSKLTGTGVSPVPEPAAVLLFGAGLAGLAAVLRRRRQGAPPGRP